MSDMLKARSNSYVHGARTTGWNIYQVVTSGILVYLLELLEEHKWEHDQSLQCDTRDTRL